MASFGALTAFAHEDNGNDNGSYDSASSTASSTVSKSKLEQFAEDIKSKFDDIRYKAFDNEKKAIGSRYDNAINSLNNMATRTESMIVKFQASSTMDLSSTTALMDIANAKIAAAQSEVAILDGLLSQITATSTALSTASTTRQSELAQIKNETKKADAALKDAQKALVNVISSLNMSIHQNDKDKDKGDYKNTTSSATSGEGTNSTSTEATSSHESGQGFRFNLGWLNPFGWFGRI